MNVGFIIGLVTCALAAAYLIYALATEHMHGANLYISIGSLVLVVVMAVVLVMAAKRKSYPNTRSRS